MKINEDRCPYGCINGKILLPSGKLDDCPIHSKKVEIELKDKRLENGESLYDVLQIPLDYQGYILNDIETLFRNPDIMSNCLSASVIQLKEVLNEIYNLLTVDNNIYMRSIYAYANPILIDLKEFVYTIVQIAFEKNISVLPVTSINDLAGLIALQDYGNVTIRDSKDIHYISSMSKLAGQGADWSYRTHTVYTDYLNCSVCVITDSNATTNGNLEIFKGFLEERSMRNLPTYVFSTCFFDTKRENLLYDKTGKRRLASLTPYLLLGKSQEYMAREKGWLRKSAENQPKSLNDFGNYKASSIFQTTRSANNFDL